MTAIGLLTLVSLTLAAPAPEPVPEPLPLGRFELRPQNPREDAPSRYGLGSAFDWEELARGRIMRKGGVAFLVIGSLFALTGGLVGGAWLLMGGTEFGAGMLVGLGLPGVVASYVGISWIVRGVRLERRALRRLLNAPARLELNVSLGPLGASVAGRF
jgi:hypothetical protein